MLTQPSQAPVLSIEVQQASPDFAPSLLDGAVADLALQGGGRLRARNGEHAVRFSVPELPPDAELLHPYLAPAAALVWQWAGQEALHGGAVKVAAGVVLVFGAKEAGKSTLLAWLARELGLPVLADDLAVIENGSVLAGPRSIDLREPVDAETSGRGGVAVRGGARTRVHLPPAELSAPVAGSVLLRWDSRVAIEAVPPAERIALLAAQRTYPPLLGDPTALLELASHPMFLLTRPRGLAGLETMARGLIERFG
jgi:hypothetical protein